MTLKGDWMTDEDEDDEADEDTHLLVCGYLVFAGRVALLHPEAPLVPPQD